MLSDENYSKIMHEIKNNITFINSSLQLMAKKHPEVETFDYWNDVLSEVTILKNSMVELSSAGLSNDLSFAPVDVNTFLSELMLSCNPIFEPKNFKCMLYPQSTLPTIYADTNRLKRAFINLLKNSFEAMSGKGFVELHITSDKNFVRFDLVDFGGGFAPDYLTEIFTPFKTTKADGTGLGLVIAQQIIDLHGGQLHIDSRPGDGCTFSIYVPISKQS